MASTNGKALAAVLGDKVVIRYDDGYHVNPDSTGTRMLHPNMEQNVINHLAFPATGGRFPLPDKELAASGVAFAYEGF